MVVLGVGYAGLSQIPKSFHSIFVYIGFLTALSCANNSLADSATGEVRVLYGCVLVVYLNTIPLTPSMIRLFALGAHVRIRLLLRLPHNSPTSQ
jgi:hypothetical protein